MSPLTEVRVARARFNAVATRSVFIRLLVAQPTIRLENRSATIAKYNPPSGKSSPINAKAVMLFPQPDQLDSRGSWAMLRVYSAWEERFYFFRNDRLSKVVTQQLNCGLKGIFKMAGMFE